MSLLPSESYSSRLLTAEWQKTRLEIFERDGWACVVCERGLGDRIALHVHHRRYTAGEPWDEPLENLETRCADCHDAAHREGEPIPFEEWETRTRWAMQHFSILREMMADLTKELETLKQGTPRR